MNFTKSECEELITVANIGRGKVREDSRYFVGYFMLADALEERLSPPIIDRVFLDAISKRIGTDNVPIHGFVHQIVQATVDEIWGER